MDGRVLSAVGHGESLAVDACLEQPIHGVQEVVAVELRMESHDAAAEQAMQNLSSPGADGERFGVGPGNVPERDDGGVGPSFADEARQQREMVVLHQHHRIVAVRLGDDRVGEAGVHQAVVVPIGFAEGRAHVGVVTQWPKTFVRETRVVAGLLFAL